MHPEIKKFWEEVPGYRLVGPSLIDSWEVHIPVGGLLPIYLIEIVYHGGKYRFDNNWYSEEDMLRLIKLKVYL